ncbi:MULTISPECIES: hypothetical protein [Winogradskyella]|uniref:hypothetical protein n=1 Tax=Winogradskyella TaxID=286104 RepID=UPI000C8EC198|nr:hypothetical protein [Winogradskyella sp. MH6]MAB48901.1 hypothetical protein [Flavobacteriaceae bacterium]|tara:strand:+ start:1284 stop:2621 length:1338 start_codon:yes stop_codon:yes gene_type:complete
MKSILKITSFILVFTLASSLYAQDKSKRDLDNYRQPDKRGINVFEAPKDTVSTFENIKVRIGGSSTLQFQALDHENGVDQALIDGGTVQPLQEIGSNFNLATANLDLDVALAKGVRMHLRTYLSSRHHPEPYVKGGYFQIDNLDFISPGLLENVMKYTTIKVGHMENNYGDAHFRRTDNAQAIYNPFVGNLIMDSFTTEVGAEIYYQRNGFLGMIGFSNGKLNQDVEINNGSNTGGAAFIAKLGYDKQINDDLRFRLTGSLYNTGYAPSVYLYTADRAGSRYYSVMTTPTYYDWRTQSMQNTTATNTFRTGRFDPGFSNRITAIMFNPFVKYGGLEFFGTLEFANGGASSEADDRSTTQLAGEVIYRFGSAENFYIGGRYNTVSSEQSFGDVDIDRVQLSAGYFLTKNILAKVEYVSQSYDGYAEDNVLYDGKFNGLMVEAVISF